MKNVPSVEIAPSAPVSRFGPTLPLGARPVDPGVQFSIFSRHAQRVWLLLFDDPRQTTPSREIELDPAQHRLGDIWHFHEPQARVGQGYLYRMEGPLNDPHYDPHEWLLDPYALAIAGHPSWGDPGDIPPGTRPRDGAAMPKGVIVDHAYDWTGDRSPATPMEDTIIYEAHLRGFTAHSSSGVAHPGTYRGFQEKIPYLQDLGITAVEFLPIHEFNELEYYLADDPRRDLRNYWGYSTLGFFAPNGRYAADGVYGQQVTEFKDLVKALHQANIEVILDVVYNHTLEGGQGGPTYAYRGIDNDIYYMMDEDEVTYRNFSGCGNTVNGNHPVVQSMILDSLRYWVHEMHVDGFRFDLATVLTRDQQGNFLANPPVIEAISEDPLLRHTKLIAEAWDAAGGYQVGSFPSPYWSEWNGKYRDEVRKYWKGDDAMLGPFTHRISGSADLYDRPKQTPLKSINFITCHDGFTLHDLVSYNHKHNEANCEDNRDGENHNESDNCGREGPTFHAGINRLRLRRMKNFVATLMLSQGVPMLLAGDEFASTQDGNNNAYCQDNPLAWLDWDRLDAYRELHAFVKEAIAFRKQHPLLRRTKFFKGKTDQDASPDIEWFGPHGKTPTWHHGKALGCLLHPGDADPEDTLFIVYNAGKRPMDFDIPAPPLAPWIVALTTEEILPAWPVFQQTLRVEGHSITVLRSAPKRSGR